MALSFKTPASQKARYISKPQTKLASLSPRTQLPITKTGTPTAKPPPPPPPPKKYTGSSKRDHNAQLSSAHSSALQFVDDTLDDLEKV